MPTSDTMRPHEKTIQRALIHVTSELDCPKPRHLPLGDGHFEKRNFTKRSHFFRTNMRNLSDGTAANNADLRQVDDTNGQEPA